MIYNIQITRFYFIWIVWQDPTGLCLSHKGCSNVNLSPIESRKCDKQLLSPRVTQAIFESRSDNLNGQRETVDGLALPILKHSISNQIVQARIKPTQK